MNLQVLYQEILLPAYSGKTDQQIADMLNAKTRSAERAVVESYEVLECIVPSEFTALTAAEKTRVQSILACGKVNLRGPNTRGMLAAAFDANTTTRANLIALQGKAVSRAEELGLGEVQAGDVARVKGGRW